MWSRRRPQHAPSGHSTQLGGTPDWLAHASGDSWLETTSTGPFPQPSDNAPAWSTYDPEPIYHPRQPTARSTAPEPDLAPATALPVPQNGDPAPALVAPLKDPELTSPVPPPRAELPPQSGELDAGEASALAAFFAADLLSWSEENPDRWYEVISRYLPGIDVRELGWWDGIGRQRVDLALPGRITRRGSDRITVEVRVRIVPYSRNPRAPETTPPVAPPPAVPDYVTSTAPPPAAAGWRGHDAYSARMHVPIRRAPNGALIVDAAHLTAQEAP